MLKELNHYENLGTPGFFYELFIQIATSRGAWKRKNINQYFYNRIIDGNSVFDGCLPLAESIGAVMFDELGILHIDQSLQSSLFNKKYFSKKFLEMIIAAAKEDDIFYEIFCPNHTSYDVIYRLIQINNAAFGFKYASFRKLLQSFEFLFPHPDKNIRKFILNSRYRQFFDQSLLPEIKKRKIGISALEKMLEQKRIHGKQAEIFVLGYEKLRLSAHERVKDIERISDYDAGAGYDIISYESVGSEQYDRFIEVKSYSGTPNFFWSRNEIEVAHAMRNQYFLYLVDRDNMHKPDYEPRKIRNPYKELMETQEENMWDKTPENYFIIEKSHSGPPQVQP